MRHFLITALASGLGLAATFGTAASATTFVLDDVASTITLTKTAGVCVPTPASCTLTANLGAAATGYSFTANAVGETDTVVDFIDWTIVLTKGLLFGFIPVDPAGAGLYSVDVNLVFSSPSVASDSATGAVGYATLGGLLSAGFLNWNGGGVGNIAFADGSALSYDLEGGFALGTGLSTSSGVTFTATALPSSVPLPAAGLLLLGALGAAAAVRRRKAKADA